MSSDPTPANGSPQPSHTAATDPGLPPVEPPSGQMILRLFVVPALIVSVLVGLFLLGPRLSGWVNRMLGRSSADSRSAGQFLRDLDNPNPEVRYRTASDLAQVLLRKEELAADPTFALELADRLRAALDESAAAEKEFAGRADGLSTGERAKELKKLEPHRNLIVFLGASLGNCKVPVGVPLLKQLATQEGGMEADALAERRRRALFALATLGEKLSKYDQLDDAKKDAIEEQLQQAVQNGNARFARPTLEYLRARRQGKADSFGVADTLARCAGDEDPSIRFFTALASNFWTGTATEEKLIEDFLIKLAVDAGVGQDRLDERLAKNPDSVRSREVTKKPGFDVQANATIALARRGSPRVRLELLELMLNPDELREIFVIQAKGGAEQPNEALVVLTVTDSLKALARLARQRPEMKLDRFAGRIEELAGSPNASVGNEARQTQLALQGRK